MIRRKMEKGKKNKRFARQDKHRLCTTDQHNSHELYYNSVHNSYELHYKSVQLRPNQQYTLITPPSEGSYRPSLKGNVINLSAIKG